MAIQPGSTEAPGSGGLTNPMTHAGDMIIGGAGGTPLALSAGDPGYILSIDSSGDPEWVPFFLNGGTTIEVGDWLIGPDAIYSTNPLFTTPFFETDGDGVLVQGQYVVVGVVNGARLDVLSNGFIFFDPDSDQVLQIFHTGPGTNTVAFNNVTSFTVDGVGFIQNQDAAAQASANAWIDGLYITSSADYFTFLSPGGIAVSDLTGGSATWGFHSSPIIDGRYWVQAGGDFMFGNILGCNTAPVIPSDVARLNELQLPFGAWSGQVAGITVVDVTAISSGLSTDVSIYEIGSSVNWLVGSTGSLTIEVDFTDSHGTTVTKSLTTNIVGAATYITIPTQSVTAKAGTQITVRTQVTGTVNYDVTGFIRYIYLIP